MSLFSGFRKWKDEELKKCFDCKCLIEKSDAQKIVVKTIYSLLSWIDEPTVRYYCNTHKKPYDRVSGSNYFKDDVRCDENGKIEKK